MAAGSKDSNGIWQYGEDDLRALFSDLLNLATASVSVAVGAIKSRLTTLETKTAHITDSDFKIIGATGNPPFASGWSGVFIGGWNGLAFRKRDGILYLNGAYNKASWVAGELVMTLPVGYRPSRQTRVFAYGSAFHSVDIYVDGSVRMTIAGGGSVVVAGVIPI
ncbi:hypothetical protein [Plantibacter sp. YIM 135249]|uniref:hypothetical protein n=1 Tax=Plantibacter sp. YIM 135249 TaxID=3423918 RepID=UPI003D324BF7